MRVIETAVSTLVSPHTQIVVAETVLINSAIKAHNEGQPIAWQAAGIVLVTGMELAYLYQLKKKRKKYRSWENVRENAEPLSISAETSSDVYLAAEIAAATDTSPSDLGNYNWHTVYRTREKGPDRNITEIFIKTQTADEILPDIIINDKLRDQETHFEIKKGRSSDGDTTYAISRVTYSDREVYHKQLQRTYLVPKAQKNLHAVTEAEGQRLLERLQPPSKVRRLTR